MVKAFYCLSTTLGRIMVLSLTLLSPVKKIYAQELSQQIENQHIPATVAFPKGRATLKVIIRLIHKQYGISIAWPPGLFNQDSVVDVPPGDTVEEVLGVILSKMGLMLSWDSPHQITIIRQPSKQAEMPGTVYHSRHVQLRSEEGEPLAGASLFPNTGQGFPPKTGWQTDNNGMKEIMVKKDTLKLRASYTGMDPQNVIITSDTTMIILHPSQNMLDAVISGYGTGTKRTNTDGRIILFGPSFKPMPGSPFLNELEGKVPGYYLTQKTGISLGAEHISLGSDNSLLNGPDPLFVINGVPFASGNQSVSNNQFNPAGSSSPMVTLALQRAIRIEVIKDADGTAIYGSRGANGVILITTPHGQPGKLTYTADASVGWISLGQTVKLMNSPQYLAMRDEAFRLDGKTPTRATAPDLFDFDTTSYTDWRRRLIGNIGHQVAFRGSLSGGRDKLNFYADASGTRESSVFSEKPLHTNINSNIGINIRPNKKLSIQLTGMYGWDDAHLHSTDLTAWTLFAPIGPGPDRLVDAQDRPVSVYNTDTIGNPLTFVRQTYVSHICNWLADGLISWKALPWLSLKANLGWNRLAANEYSDIPIYSQPAGPGVMGTSFSSSTVYTGYIIEPQAEATKDIGQLHMALLSGYSNQRQRGRATSFDAFGFSSDNWLHDRAKAQMVDTASAASSYNYTALFARLNFRWNDKYILNLTARRDGSSRLSNNKQYGDFYATGIAWVFSSEPFIKTLLPFLTYGKARVSMGKTGNDQIGQGHYLSGWAPRTPSNIYNVPGWNSLNHIADGHTWETIYKTEAGIELGLFNKLLFTANRYRNHSTHQLLPDPTDPTIWRNYDVVLENKGWDLSLTLSVIGGRKTGLDLSLNWSIPHSRLVSFPNLMKSMFRDVLLVGQSVNTQQLYKYVGVDAATGVYSFLDANHDGKYDKNDLIGRASFDVKGYGGITVRFFSGNFHFEMTVDGRYKTGSNYLAPFYSENPPGTAATVFNNLPAELTHSWKYPGDHSSIQRVSQSDTTVSTANGLFLSSTGIASNTSFARIKRLFASYDLPDKWLGLFGKKHPSVMLFLNAENLATFSRYKGIAETEDMTVLPPLRTVVVGIRLSH